MWGMTEGVYTRHVNLVVDEIASHIEEEREEIDFVNLQEYTIQNLKEAIEAADIGKYIIRALYFAISKESKPKSDEYKNYDYEWIGEAITHCLKYQNNSKFKSHKNDHIDQFIQSWTNPNETNAKERDSIIELAIIGHIDPKALNHILKVQLGECGLNSLRPKEAVALYVLQNKLGFDGYIDLKGKLEKLTNEICADPKKVLSRLQENRNQMTQYVNKKVSETQLFENEFLSYITDKPLTCYSEALKNALDKNYEDWINALNEEKPEFLKNLPKTRRGAFHDYVRQYFPGYSLHGETARIIYLNLLEDNEKRAKALKNIYKNRPEYILESKLKKQMDLSPAEDLEDTITLEELIDKIAEEVRLPEYAERTNLLTYYENAPEMVRKFPDWCKNAFRKILGDSHMIQIKADKETVLANDIALMKLWKLDLEIQERILKADESGIKPSDIENFFEKTDIENFFEDTDYILDLCNMGSLHMSNPFHALVRVALAEKDLFPLDTFLGFFEVLGLSKEKFYGDLDISIEKEPSRTL